MANGSSLPFFRAPNEQTDVQKSTGKTQYADSHAANVEAAPPTLLAHPSAGTNKTLNVEFVSKPRMDLVGWPGI